jgi:hypothetical protein
MRIRALIATAACLLLVLSVSVQAQSGERTLMYSYQRDGQVVHIAFFDLPPGLPACHIEDARELPKSARDFEISKLEFDHIWSALTASELKQFERKQGSSSEIETLNYYVFTTAYLPDGEKKMFVVPKDRAPKSVAELVREIRAYNRD